MCQKSVFVGNFTVLLYSKEICCWSTQNSCWDLQDQALLETTYRDWFRHFKNNNFDVADKEYSGTLQKVEDKELEALFHEDSCQVQAELAESLGIDHTIVMKHLKELGIIQKQGRWVQYELKPRDIKWHVVMREQLFKQQKRKCFLYYIMTSYEKWIHYDNPKHRRSWGKPSHASTSATKPNIHSLNLLLYIWWAYLGIVYYKLLQLTKNITGDHYQLQLMHLSWRKNSHYISTI